MDSSSATGSVGCAEEWAAPAWKDLLPELSREEQQRLQSRGLSGRDRRKLKGRISKAAPPSPPSSMTVRAERERDAFFIKTVQDALRHYNARHQGGEFDAVKPPMEQRVGFRGQVWFHLNLWASSRSTNKIKRFFAEVHYQAPAILLQRRQPPSDSHRRKEPLSQHRTACAFCPARFDILRPKGCRKFVCGNDKDRIGQRLEPCRPCYEPSLMKGVGLTGNNKPACPGVDL